MDLRSSLARPPSFASLYENSAEDIRHQIRAQQLASLRRIAEEYKRWKEKKKKKDATEPKQKRSSTDPSSSNLQQKRSQQSNPNAANGVGGEMKKQKK